MMSRFVGFNVADKHSPWLNYTGDFCFIGNKSLFLNIEKIVYIYNKVW